MTRLSLHWCVESRRSHLGADGSRNELGRVEQEDHCHFVALWLAGSIGVPRIAWWWPRWRCPTRSSTLCPHPARSGPSQSSWRHAIFYKFV